MKKTLMIGALALVLPCIGGAQDAGEGVRFEFGATLNAVLSDTVDARKSKPGDAIRARTSEDVKAAGKVVIPRGARLMGHVTEARTATNSTEQSRLGITFDRADLKEGGQVALHTTFYALAAPAGAPGSFDSSGGGFGGGFTGGSESVGNMVSAAGRAASDDTSALGSGSAHREDLKPSPGAIGGLNNSGTLYASSRGVFGLEDVSLEPAAVPSRGSSVIVANARTVRLSSGTRVLLSLESADKP